ncbi:MAG TPA: hypothetical protein VGA58_00895 [bacterium]
MRGRLERALHRLVVLALDGHPSPAEPIHVSATEGVRARVGGIFVPTLREESVGAIVPGGTEMGKMLDLHTLAEPQVFTAPYDQDPIINKMTPTVQRSNHMERLRSLAFVAVGVPQAVLFHE